LTGALPCWVMGVRGSREKIVRPRRMHRWGGGRTPKAVAVMRLHTQRRASGCCGIFGLRASGGAGGVSASTPPPTTAPTGISRSRFRRSKTRRGTSCPRASSRRRRRVSSTPSRPAPASRLTRPTSPQSDRAAPASRRTTWTNWKRRRGGGVGGRLASSVAPRTSTATGAACSTSRGLTGSSSSGFTRAATAVGN
jgi:hypothetical protein